jgi:DMSO/TMAO reductase YedYZ heme-binding membrane subunit
MMVGTAIGMTILLPLALTSFKFSMEVQFGFMLFFLLGGLI